MLLKKLSRWLLFFALCMATRLVAAQVNPILLRPDPFITWEPVNGRYLLLATANDKVSIWSGATVPTAATDVKTVFTAVDGMQEIWSPTLWHIQGSWWIYFTANMMGQEHGIYVLQSDTDDPLGTYTFRGALDLGRPAIDPSLLTVDGTPYLMYVTITGGENAIWMTRLDSPMRTRGGKSLISEPEYPWERGAGGTRTGPVNEGPTALYHGGKTFIVYSGSDTASPFYCLGLLTFKGGNPLKRRNWLKTDHPVFAQNPAVGIVGPGRGTFAHAADGTDWLLFAAMRADHIRVDRRAIRAQRFTWNADGSPNFGEVQADGPIPTD